MTDESSVPHEEEIEAVVEQIENEQEGPFTPIADVIAALESDDPEAALDALLTKETPEEGR